MRDNVKALSEIGARYASLETDKLSPSLDQDFLLALRVTSDRALARVLATAFRAVGTSSFATILGDLYRSSKERRFRSELLNIIGTALPTPPVGFSFLKQFKTGRISPKDTDNISAEQMVELATVAESLKPGVIDIVSDYVARRRSLLVNLDRRVRLVVLSTLARLEIRGELEGSRGARQVSVAEALGVKNHNSRGDDVGGNKTCNASDDQVQVTSYFPSEVKPELWYTLLAYVHVKRAQNAVHEDSQIRLGHRPKDYRKGHGKATETIARGTEIVLIPELPGCRFNPTQARVFWLEDWHRIEFRMQASRVLPHFALNAAVNGRLSFYVGPILVAEIKLWTHISDDIEFVDAGRPESSRTADPYQAVFVSYSRRDRRVVLELERAYVALGMKYLSDVRELRSGEKWNPALLKKIDAADIFQLCWSTTAATSINVAKEWRHALELRRPSFIRPVYWETPMPKPPVELSDVHFAYLDK